MLISNGFEMVRGNSPFVANLSSKKKATLRFLLRQRATVGKGATSARWMVDGRIRPADYLRSWKILSRECVSGLNHFDMPRFIPYAKRIILRVSHINVS